MEILHGYPESCMRWLEFADYTVLLFMDESVMANNGANIGVNISEVDERLKKSLIFLKKIKKILYYVEVLLYNCIQICYKTVVNGIGGKNYVLYIRNL